MGYNRTSMKFQSVSTILATSVIIAMDCHDLLLSID